MTKRSSLSRSHRSELLRPGNRPWMALTVALLACALPAGAAAERVVGTRNVAIVLFDGVELLDFSGPGEVFAAAASFGQAAGRDAFEVYTVAVSAKPLLSQGFVRIVPQYGLADSPRPDILIIPGGDVGPLLSSPEFMRWLRSSAAGAEVTMSVCTGAFVLAQAGLLDGLDVTTYYGAIASLREEAPKARVHADRRLIDNGRILTTAGVSAGIDGALHLVSRLLGREVAERTARYMEYRWIPEPGQRAPAAPGR